MQKDKPIYDLTPMTMLDYPKHLAAIIWFAGCSMRCGYCYNPDIVMAKNGKFGCNDILTFLKKRQGLLDAVVLSGGECTNYKDIVNFCQDIKSLGFKIKIDTNGTYPEVLKTLIEQNLIDYVALDYKAPKDKFKKITGITSFNKFYQSLDLLINKNIDFEVRTTVHSELLDENDINYIADDLINRGYKNTYYIQKFIAETPTLAKIPQQNKWINKAKIKSELKIKIRQ